MAMDKTYNPGDIETRWSQHWEESGAFKCGQRPDAEPYTIVMPPPNVTGSLHMGHALDNTLQDVLIRFERLRGKDVLWQPGVDHAGIATQMVVERQLDAEGLSRREMGREKFLERVWAWKEESGGTITGQLRRLGASCDWSRERFTMDEGFSKAVLKKFVALYKDDLLYRDKRLVNWDPKLKTAISDLEVEQKEIQGNLYHFKYPIDGEDGQFVTVATTRPETMFGDTGVAVHPDDERYKALVGKHVILPMVGRKIPIVTDSYADPEQGSGAVKMTPAHDFNDFEVGKRQNLEMINILDEDGNLNDNVPEDFRGMGTKEARKLAVERMEALGLVDKIEPHTHMVPTGDRSGVVIEPWLTTQWYVDAPTLAKEPIAAVKDGRTKFIPKNWEKTYFHWMENIQPWCVSRQLWWGHQIPAWYAEDGTVFVAETEDDAYVEAREKLGADVKLTRDEDVLDTWFSSALWPFGTLGWPDDEAMVDRYYPNATLVTGFDIIFFWVARMMMDGMYFKKDVPFKNVYIHALVRDETGAKMSKSKGNVIDPLDYINKYGADALRFTLAAMEAQGRDIKLSESRVEGYRNFGTKLWNATRFAEMHECLGGGEGFDPKSTTQPLTKWIVGEVQKTTEKLTGALDAFRFNDAADAIYHFAWGTFCDWYLELIKPTLFSDDEAAKAEVRKTTAWVLDQILTLLHPFMPFITEELWHAVNDKRGDDLILSAWPTLDASLVDAEADADVNWLIKMITEIRSIRSEVNIPGGAMVDLLIVGDIANKPELKKLINQEKNLELFRLARLKHLGAIEAISPSSASVQFVVDNQLYAIPLEGVLDLDAERARLTKALEKASKEIKTIEGRLNNPGFVDKAPAHVVEEAKAKIEDEKAAREKLEIALKRLS